jgi:hypothetical protein
VVKKFLASYRTQIFIVFTKYHQRTLFWASLSQSTFSYVIIELCQYSAQAYGLDDGGIWDRFWPGKEICPVSTDRRSPSHTHTHISPGQRNVQLCTLLQVYMRLYGDSMHLNSFTTSLHVQQVIKCSCTVTKKLRNVSRAAFAF